VVDHTVLSAIQWSCKLPPVNTVPRYWLEYDSSLTEISNVSWPTPGSPLSHACLTVKWKPSVLFTRAVPEKVTHVPPRLA